jgi:hypothetical protein
MKGNNFIEIQSNVINYTKNDIQQGSSINAIDLQNSR